MPPSRAGSSAASTTVTWMHDACSVRARTELWTCPKCGRRFVGRNMWRACGDSPVEGFLDGKGARARELFEGFERLIAECGPYEVASAASSRCGQPAGVAPCEGSPGTDLSRRDGRPHRL